MKTEAMWEMTADEYIKSLPEGEHYTGHEKLWGAIASDAVLKSLALKHDDHGIDKPNKYADEYKPWQKKNAVLEKAIDKRLDELGLPSEAFPLVVNTLPVRLRKHKREVAKMLAAGKKVSAAVLADYPDLKPAS